MLIEFRFKNFRSFRDEQIFSLVASAGKDLFSNTFEHEAMPKKRFLRSAVIYGANASGKSNVVKALDFVEKVVRRSAEVNPNTELPVRSFLLDEETASDPSEFEFTFVHNDIRYQYGFIVDRSRVYEEWLLAYPKLAPQTWFERTWKPKENDYEWYFGPYLKGEKNRLTPLTRENVLFLSLAAKFNQEQLSIVYEWFTRHLQTIEFGENPSTIEQVTFTFVDKNKELHSNVNKLLRMANLGIVDFVLEKEAIDLFNRSVADDMPDDLKNAFQVLTNYIRTEVDSIERFKVSLRHQSAYDEETLIPFRYEDESLGTRKLLALSGLIFGALSDGDVLVIDELDSSLHPILLRRIVSLFNNPDTNPKNAQLIFNTHDITLLDANVFRRDQIWLTEKDNTGASYLYPLLDFSPRKTEAFGKGYIQGKYGAVPIIGSFVGLINNGS